MITRAEDNNYFTSGGSERAKEHGCRLGMLGQLKLYYTGAFLRCFFFFQPDRCVLCFSVGLGDGSDSVCRRRKKREEGKVDRRRATPPLSGPKPAPFPPPALVKVRRLEMRRKTTSTLF